MSNRKHPKGNGEVYYSLCLGTFRHRRAEEGRSVKASEIYFASLTSDFAPIVLKKSVTS